MRIMKCCNPIPGDQVVGYLTREAAGFLCIGQGVSVSLMNRKDFYLLNGSKNLPPRTETQPPDIYPVKIFVECSDQPGMLGAITTAIAKYKVNIRSGTFQPSTERLDATASDYLTIDVTGAGQLEEVMQAIRGLKGVQRVIRKF